MLRSRFLRDECFRAGNTATHTKLFSLPLVLLWLSLPSTY